MRSTPIFHGARTFGAVANLQVGDTPIDVRYLNLSMDCATCYTPATFATLHYKDLLSVSATHRVVNGLDVALTWGHEFPDIDSLDDLDLIQASATASF